MSARTVKISFLTTTRLVHRYLVASGWAPFNQASACILSIRTAPRLAISQVFSAFWRGIAIAQWVTVNRILPIVALTSFAILTFIAPLASPAQAAAKTVAGTSCVDRYNSLLKGAKAALIAGDRGRAVNLLEEAKRVLPVCPALREGSSPHQTMVSMNACRGQNR